MDAPGSAAAVRAAARAGRWPGTTRGAAPGHIQCNVVILPAADAEGFAGWCERNAAVAPLLARSEPGDPRLPGLGEIDLRVDLPAYRRLDRGAFVEELEDLAGWWTDDLVGFAFGCSFSLEDALRAAGIPLAYGDRGFGGATYVTSIETQPHAGYAGPLVASMRPLPEAEAARAVEVSRRYPQLHGAPVHVGDPAAIGVDLDEPLDVIGAVDVAPGEVPVFWACGVTTQMALEHARPARAFTHVSARMLVCDLRLDELVPTAGVA
jgi:uncharacterized protein YcsI (UPF0317 family)